jgi:two-component system, NtrC family, response regulator AtoC
MGGDARGAHSVDTCLSANGFQAERVGTGAAALARFYRAPLPDLLLLELGTGREAVEILKTVRKLHPGLKVVVLAHPGDNRQVVEAIRVGAQDYITVPFREVDLLQLLKRHLDVSWEGHILTKETVEEVGEKDFFVTASAAMQRIRVQAELLANIDVPVLILGESGTGKEVTAQLIHKLSARAGRRFLKVNCAALPAELLESELFGYERGAFTGALRTKAGKFELCEKGTILLDEVAEMPASLQAKLLHVLQDRQFFRLGGETTIEVDVRILAATNVNIQQAMADRRFREDLYYRLSAFTICLPPLRKRREEVPVLLRHFMQRIASQYSRPLLSFSQRLLDACLHYSWPGNVRELQNFIKRYVVMADEDLAIAELQANDPNTFFQATNNPRRDIRSASLDASITNNEGGYDLKHLIRNIKDQAEVQAITKALSETNWNRKQAARLLHISYRGLLNKIRQHAINRPERLSGYRDRWPEIRSLREFAPAAATKESAVAWKRTLS